MYTHACLCACACVRARTHTHRFKAPSPLQSELMGLNVKSGVVQGLRGELWSHTLHLNLGSHTY